MVKLFIAGDSFASLIQGQPIGTSWSERLATQLDMTLVNVARAAASNVSIAIQLDWIVGQARPHDLVLVWLTDHSRITIVNDFAQVDPAKSLLSQHSPHKEQISIADGVYVQDSIVSSMAGNPTSNVMKHYATRSFDPTFQRFLDEYTVTGALAKLKTVTKNFIVFPGGFACASPDTFLLATDNWHNYTSDAVQKLNARHEHVYGNHLTMAVNELIANELSERIRLVSPEA